MDNIALFLSCSTVRWRFDDNAGRTRVRNASVELWEAGSGRALLSFG